MKLHHTPERLRKRAALDTAKKMRLEPHLAKNMRRVLKSMVHDFRVTYPQRQETIIPIKYKSDVVGILREHYRKVIRDFISATRDEHKSTKSFQIKAGVARDKKIDDKIRQKLSPYVLVHSEQQAGIILQTTHDDLHEAIERAINDSLDSGLAIDSTDIADIVSRDYLQRIEGRAELISVTETQSLSEKTKKTELEELAEDLQDEDSEYRDDDEEGTEDEDSEEAQDYSQFDEVWVAILDDLTREAHAEADGQIVSMGEPYIVDGEELMYPGDPDGSPGNIMFCRCCSVPINGGESFRGGD